MARDPFRRHRRSRIARVLWVLAGVLLLAVAAVAVFGPRLVADRLNPVTRESKRRANSAAARPRCMRSKQDRR